jgi:alkylated DNA repair dioxygenase AlkB
MYAMGIAHPPRYDTCAPCRYPGRPHIGCMGQTDFIGRPAILPEGFVYEQEFLSPREESALLEIIRLLPFQEAQYRQWQAKRRVVSFGGRYDFTHHALNEAPPIPEFLHPLRERICGWSGIPLADVHHAMIVEYQPGTSLGWHRDVPNFDQIVGVSLLGHARMRLRPYPPQPGQRSTHAIVLEPRSAYMIKGAARWGWQHAISPTKELRYSITFRTLRR